MEDFFIDKIGDDNEGKESTAKNKNDLLKNEEIVSGLFDGVLKQLTQKATKLKKKKKEFNFDKTYIISNYKDENPKGNASLKVNKILARSVIKPGLEKRHKVAEEKRKKVVLAIRKKRRQRTKGDDWFNMKAPRLTEELKTDLELLKMRSVLDSKHVYKKNDITKIPKFFQVGKVVESPADFYGGRIPKSQRKKTMVDELLADAEFKKYQKKKFKEIMDENRRQKRTKKNLKKLREDKALKQKSKKSKK